MHDLWGMTGPVFLGRWSAAMALVVLLGWAAVTLFMPRAHGPAGVGARWRRWRPGRTRWGMVALPSRLITVDEVAYLRGGGERVVETAIARLLGEGALRVSRPATVAAVAGAASPDPVGVLVLAAAPEPESIAAVIKQVRPAPAVSEVAQRLTDEDLILDPDRARRWMVASAGPAGCVWLVAMVRLVVDWLLSRSLLLVFVAVVLGAVAVLALVARNAIRPSRSLRTLLARVALPDRAPPLRSAPDSAPDRGPGPPAAGGAGEVVDGLALPPGLLESAAGAVAVAGLKAYPDPDLVPLLIAPPGGTSGPRRGDRGGGLGSDGGWSDSGGSSGGGWFDF